MKTISFGLIFIYFATLVFGAVQNGWQVISMATLASVFTYTTQLSLFSACSTLFLAYFFSNFLKNLGKWKWLLILPSAIPSLILVPQFLWLKLALNLSGSVSLIIAQMAVNFGFACVYLVETRSSKDALRLHLFKMMGVSNARLTWLSFYTDRKRLFVLFVTLFTLSWGSLSLPLFLSDQPTVEVFLYRLAVSAMENDRSFLFVPAFLQILVLSALVMLRQGSETPGEAESSESLSRSSSHLMLGFLVIVHSLFLSYPFFPTLQSWERLLELVVTSDVWMAFLMTFALTFSVCFLLAAFLLLALRFGVSLSGHRLLLLLVAPSIVAVGVVLSPLKYFGSQTLLDLITVLSLVLLYFPIFYRLVVGDLGEALFHAQKLAQLHGVQLRQIWQELFFRRILQRLTLNLGFIGFWIASSYAMPRIVGASITLAMLAEQALDSYRVTDATFFLLFALLVGFGNALIWKGVAYVSHRKL